MARNAELAKDIQELRRALVEMSLKLDRTSSELTAGTQAPAAPVSPAPTTTPPEPRRSPEPTPNPPATTSATEDPITTAATATRPDGEVVANDTTATREFGGMSKAQLQAFAERLGIVGVDRNNQNRATMITIIRREMKQ